jgi:hypothetical protein
MAVTKLTPSVQNKIVVAITAGLSMASAASFARIDRSTFFRWLDKGRRARRGPYHELVAAIDKARADLEANLVARLIQKAREQPELILPVLERKFASEWGRAAPRKLTADEAGAAPKAAGARFALPKMDRLPVLPEATPTEPSVTPSRETS